MVFFHTADLHLGAGMEANMPQDKAAERRLELLETFSALVNEAQKADASAVLIAGDLFDTETPAPTTVNRVASVIEAHPGLDFLILAGNHDGALPVSLTSLANVHVFPADRPACYRYGEVAVYGCGDCTRPPDDFPLAEGDCNIVMLHGETSESATQTGIDLRAWRGRHVDYLALGHYHRADICPLDSRGCYAYAGCPAARGFDECGEKGYIRLTVENGRITPVFVPLPGRRMHAFSVNVSDSESPDRIQSRLYEACRDIPAQDGIRVELKGTLPPGASLPTAALKKVLEQTHWFVKIKDSTVCKAEADAYRHDISLAGTFIRLVLEEESDPDLAREIISLGVAALRGEETEV